MFEFFFKFLKNLSKKKEEAFGTGLIEDPRITEEKEKDYKAEELLAAFVPITWVEKPESEWRKFPIFNQDGSSSCVAQATSKALGIENYLEEKKFVHFSARDIYARRSNFPGQGMWFQDGLNIAYNYGATVEQLMPSQNMNESLMNSAEDRTPLTELVAKIGKGGNYITLPIDIEAIASLIEPSGKPVLIGVRFGPNEWNRPVPQILGTDTRWGHAICATNATLYQGKKSLVVEDSWGTESGLQGRRILTEDWFNAKRIVFAGYITFLKNEGIEVKPKYQFLRDLKYGMVYDADVKKLQECLAYLKLFPTRDYFTGNFYGLTLKGVKAFQVLNDIPITGIVEIQTRTKLNGIFQ